jgi:Acyl-CoA dehydrogenase, C-terminal domain
MSLEKNATVMSYGAEADAILTTARRSPDGAASDQVLVAVLKNDYRLERLSGWDALGMRGTCSDGFVLKASGEPEQVLPAPYHEIHARSMVPISHLTWSGVWSGVAAGAVGRARAFLRNARRGGGQLPRGAAHLTRATASLQTLRAVVAAALQRYETAAEQPEELDSLGFQTAMNLLKVSASETALATMMSALQACGLAGYRNDGEFSISRPLRDILSASIMINNDRILANAAVECERRIPCPAIRTIEAAAERVCVTERSVDDSTAGHGEHEFMDADPRKQAALRKKPFVGGVVEIEDVVEMCRIVRNARQRARSTDAELRRNEAMGIVLPDEARPRQYHMPPRLASRRRRTTCMAASPPLII